MTGVPLWLGYVTFGIAVLGAVLGVVNTLHTLSRDRVRLRVMPKRAIPVGGFRGQAHRLCIEVTNLSTFPVTITEVGVLYHGTKSRGVLTEPMIIGGESLPHRLEPRSSITAYAEPGALQSDSGQRVRCAYAATDCGVTAKGDSPALHELARQENTGR